MDTLAAMVATVDSGTEVGPPSAAEFWTVPRCFECSSGARCHHGDRFHVRVMAETVHLYLTANGTKIDGESTQTSLDRADSIECLSFVDSVRTAREKSSGKATGRRSYEPLVLRKRIDKSSPLLAKALCNNEVIEGTFKFFRPSPAGDGTTEQFFTVEVAEGRIASIRRVSPDVFDPASAAEPPTEEVSIVFHTITWTYEPTGAMHTDNWRENS
jgi:type VI secretion system secreted protein Hcp